MYCDKEHVNLLTALLPQADVADVVVCPGSRNGVLVHNFHRLAAAGVRVGGRRFRIYPVTDERSAAFVALGISLARGGRPVAVCVTSGSALLGTIPAVAEAYYRRLPLLVISADRPPRWIGQLDGQTLPQPGALRPYARTYDLPEPRTPDEAWWCRNVASEALMALTVGGGAPVHINVPISEPLFTFTTEALPDCSIVKSYTAEGERVLLDELTQRINNARLPVLLIGQHPGASSVTAAIDGNDSLLVLPELVSNQPGSRRTALLEERPDLLEDLRPDLVIHVGGNLVNKQLKLRLRRLKDCAVVRIEPGDGMPDTFSQLDTIVRGDWVRLLEGTATRLRPHAAVAAMKRKLEEEWQKRTADADGQTRLLSAVAHRLAAGGIRLSALHLGNSTVVRSATKCFDGGAYPVHCNRGVNGIEGSLSAAVGHALASEGLNLVVIGDLSFFYDQNALWNSELRGNLRVLLLNNGGGRIFDRLPGLSASPARDAYIAAHHGATAAGIAQSYGVEYLSASSGGEAVDLLPRLLAPESSRPVLLEVFLPAAEEASE